MQVILTKYWVLGLDLIIAPIDEPISEFMVAKVHDLYLLQSFLGTNA